VPESPLAAHAATPAELQARLHAEQQKSPFLVLRHPESGQILIALQGRTHLTIGRRAECDVTTDWDGRVSRLHAELVLIGGEWIITDDGLSANGTFVNASALNQRHRLRDGDLIRVGNTIIAFCNPTEPAVATLNANAASLVMVTPAQRRVLVALCRPLLVTGMLSVPSNAELASELFLSVDSIKTHMKALFQAFGLDDATSRAKRAELIQRAVRLGFVRSQDITDRPP
jgi:pSer/pThr/pTyr-binding forkhead associated (FHA) protein